VAHLAAIRDETPTARTLLLDVPDWPGHLPGQHVDVRLTAADGYQAQRSYSVANAADGDRVELTVQRVPDGEVSGYRNAGQCSGLQAGGVGPRWEGRQGPSSALNWPVLLLDVLLHDARWRAAGGAGEVRARPESLLARW